jgi:hypothetical protein
MCVDVDTFPPNTGSNPVVGSEKGLIFCAKVSKCRVVELNPTVTNLTNSGQANLVLWLGSALKTEPSLTLFFLFHLFPLDKFTFDALKSPI